MIKLVLLLPLITLIPTAAAFDSQNIEYCTRLTQDNTLALELKDWKAVTRISDKKIDNCATSDEDIAAGLEMMALASVELGRYVRAIELSEKCISYEYTNVGCYVSKADSHLKLGDISKAREMIERVHKLIPIVKRRIEEEYNRYLSDSSYPRLHALMSRRKNAELSNIDATQHHADAIERAIHAVKDR